MSLNPTQGTHFFPFLRLPQELRDLIYIAALTHPEHHPRSAIWVTYEPKLQRWCDSWSPVYSRPLGTGILRTCRGIYEEAKGIMYRHNEIWISSTVAETMQLLSQLPPVAFGQIRYLKLWLGYRDEQAKLENFVFQDDKRFSWLWGTREKVVDPWNELFTFLNNMSRLETVYIKLPANHYHFFEFYYKDSVSPSWVKYLADWTTKAQSTSQRRVCFGKGVWEFTATGDALQDYLCRLSTFEEQSAQGMPRIERPTYHFKAQPRDDRRDTFTWMQKTTLLLP